MELPFYRRVCRKIVYATASLWSDETFLKMYFWCNLGYKLNLKHPKTYNEKLQWLKLHDKHPEYTKMVDKIEAKEYVRSIIGDEYIIPTLYTYDSVDEIDFEKLPNQFVIKCTHDSGGVVVCKDKSKIDKSSIIKKLENGLKQDFTHLTREYPYKKVKPRLIAEQYMEDESGELKDYKFFCFNGKVKCFKIDFGRFIEHHANYYDTKCNLLPFGEVMYPPLFEKKLNIPDNINQMIELAEKLSQGFPFIRVDFYDASGCIYFGELTFFPASGMGQFEPEKWDYILGSYINIPV
jgi:hypothetical protein